MVFKENFVVAIKSNDQILREHQNVVQLPFGTEYSILLKNLGNTRAIVDITIDGEDVLNGHQLIVNPEKSFYSNGTLELKRFIIDGNITKGPKFKFIEKTEKISKYRGNKIEDGIIRIEYRFEKPNTFGNDLIDNLRSITPTPTYTHTYDGNTILGSSDGSYTYLRNQDHSNNFYVSNSTTNNNLNDNQVSYCSNISEIQNDQGLTAKGEDSYQEFSPTHIPEHKIEKQSYVITIQLKGFNPDKSKIQNLKTVKTKIKCDMCGTTNGSRNKHCRECGNSLKW